MSGRKRALLRMNERDRKKLKNIESRLSHVDIDFSAIQLRIEEIRTQVMEQDETRKLEQNQILANNVSHLGERIQEIEHYTQESLRNQSSIVNQVIQDAGMEIKGIKDLYDQQAGELTNRVNEFIDEYRTGLDIYRDKLDEMHRENSRQQDLAWQDLSYSQEIYSFLTDLFGKDNKYSTDINQVGLLVSTGWMNFQNGSFQAAIAIAQQAIIRAIEIRFKLEEYTFNREKLILQAVEKCTQVLELAFQSQQVQAIDLDGNELDTRINVDFWTEGSVNNAIMTLEEIQNQLIGESSFFDDVLLEELISQTLPAWEAALHDYILQSRLAVISAQTRYDVARKVVNALAEQGFELERGSYEMGDTRMPYHVLLENFEGSQVHVSVVPTKDNPLDYLLDIDSYDSEFRTESELRQRTRELLGSMEAVGLKVGQVYQAEDNNVRKIAEIASNHYSVHQDKARNEKRKSR